MSEEVTVYFDLETTALGPDNNPGAEYRFNRVVLAGWSTGIAIACEGITDFLAFIYGLQERGVDTTLVAHNLMFDLKYLLRDAETLGYDIDWTKIRYRCTMVEEYRNSGHMNKFISLEKLADKYHIPFKKGLDLGAIIASGTCVSSIPRDDLKEYLEEDVRVLTLIPASKCYWDMQYLLALAHMELNGLPIDMDDAYNMGKSLRHNMDRAYKDLTTWIEERLEWSDGTPLAPNDVNVTAPRTLSYYFTGHPTHGIGAVKDKRTIVFKDGYGPRLTDSDIDTMWPNVEPNPNLGYPMTAKILDQLAQHNKVAAAYQQYKGQNKLVNTYIKPFLHQANITGGTVHPRLNPAATSTGRLSSSSPNGQNIPPVIRNLVRSQLGTLYDIDFSQLEMVGAATLSGDVQMRTDLRNGMDIHYQTGKEVMGWKNESDMTKESRRIVKGVNFGLLYGGGAKGIAENTGADQRTVKKLIKAFYDRYPQVEKWQENVLELVKDDAWQYGVDAMGHSMKASVYQQPDKYGGRKFYFEESRSPAWMKDKYSFKPTETKNYPIQGFAGGDIVMTALSILYDLIAPLGAKFRMTVHDSILIDWVDGKEEELTLYMKEVCKIVKKIYCIVVPLNFEIVAKSYWT